MANAVGIEWTTYRLEIAETALLRRGSETEFSLIRHGLALGPIHGFFQNRGITQHDGSYRVGNSSIMVGMTINPRREGIVLAAHRGDKH